MQDRPLWMDLDKPRFEALDGARRCDVAVVGGGLTGVTTALLLAQKGVKAAVVEADEIGGSTSGRTTAKVTAQHDIRLHGLGESKARGYMAANQAGLKLISRLVDEHHIHCDFARCPAYVYARDGAEATAVEKEMDMYERLGVSARLTKDAPLPYPVLTALALDDQASFHPLKYLYALAGVLVSRGVPLFERSRVVDIERGDNGVIVRTEQGALHARAAVIATGYPLLEYPGLFFLRVHQERSYVMAARLAVETDGMGITAGDPVNSVRTLRMNGEDWLLAGGFGHKTGQEDKKADTGYEPLRDFLRSFGNAEPEYQWSAQDCETLDTIPYAGSLYREGPQVYVATGYGKWGMTNSAAAAQMLCDLITGEAVIDPDVRAVFDPLRVAPAASAKNFIVQTTDTLRAFTAGRAGIEAGDFDDITPGEGAVKRIDGKARAIYKDADGNIRMFSASCTHLRCPVEYNAAEKTFDCQCHGSRFSLTGDVIEGPAQLPLEPATDDD